MFAAKVVLTANISGSHRDGAIYVCSVVRPLQERLDIGVNIGRGLSLSGYGAAVRTGKRTSCDECVVHFVSVHKLLGPELK